MRSCLHRADFCFLPKHHTWTHEDYDKDLRAKILDELRQVPAAHAVSMLTLTKERRIPMIIASACFFEDYRQMFQILARDHDVPILELASLFPEVNGIQELKSRFGLGWNDHLNAVAHRRYAEAIADLIEVKGYHPKTE